MKINVPKKQHYVPQFILSRFSVGKKKRIYIFDKKSGRSFASHIRDVGHENNFYNHSALGNAMEFQLGELETKVAPVIESIINNGSVQHLSEVEHSSLCLFTVVQMMRVNSLRESMSEFVKIVADKWNNDVIEPNSELAKFFTVTNDELKELSIEMLGDMPGSLYPYILNKRLTLLKAPKGESFYISDNPIVKYNYLPREHRGNLGLNLKGIEVHFPISPKYCLSFLCSGLVEEIRQKVQQHQVNVLLRSTPPIDLTDSIELLNQFDSQITKELTPDNMDFHNSLQVIHCSRFIYSNNPDFVLAKDMLVTHPEISTQPRMVDGSQIF